jgi:hypothetical protein
LHQFFDLDLAPLQMEITHSDEMDNKGCDTEKKVLDNKRFDTDIKALDNARNMAKPIPFR